MLHLSVLLEESISHLNADGKELIVDATLGLGGHSERLLTDFSELKVIGIDQDEQAIQLSKQRLKPFGNRFQAFHSNFTGIADVLKSAGVEKIDGILADLGVSSMQLDSPERGFSFRFDAPLDMRMNPHEGTETAEQLLNRLDEEAIAKIIYEYGDERFSRRIARRIVEKRERGEAVKTTDQLAELVAKVLKVGRHEKIHPATRTFQALRIAVNAELDVLENFLTEAIDLLKPDGKLVVISFHSLEDQIVKRVFQKFSGKCTCPPKFPTCFCGATKKLEVVTKRPVFPSQNELDINPRARSAKLRAARKIVS